MAMHEKMLELGIESPFDERWFEPPVAGRSHHDHAIDISAYYGRRKDALLAHATQIDPEVAVLVRAARRRRVAPCTRTTTTCSPAASSTARLPEDDLFAGVREHVGERVVYDPGARSSDDRRSGELAWRSS